MKNSLFKAQVTVSRCQQHLQQLQLMVRLFATAEDGGLDDITLDSIDRLANHMSQEFRSVDNLLGQTLVRTGSETARI